MDAWAHLISLDAIKAAMAADKLDALDDMSFRDAHVFKAAGINELTLLEKIKYANHFANIREPGGRDLGVLCALEDGKKLRGYIPYYSFADDVFGDEIMYAFVHKSLDAVVLLITRRGDAHAAAIRVMQTMAEQTPFGKLCACCGTARPGLKKCPCKAVRYCSEACQRAHWAAHRACCGRGRDEI